MTSKKIMVLVMAVALCFGAMGASCDTFNKMQQDIQDFMCNPPANVVALAQAAAPFVSVAAAAGGPVAVAAYQAVTAILSSGAACATVSQVNALIDMIQGEQAKAMAKGMKAPGLDPTPLMDWLAKVAPGK